VAAARGDFDAAGAKLDCVCLRGVAGAFGQGLSGLW